MAVIPFTTQSNPLRNPTLWDSARLAGVKTPGQCMIVGGQSPRKWDVWAGYALSGATTVFTGIDIKDFDLVLQFWEDEQIDEYYSQLVPILNLPPKGERPRALTFFHPAVSEPPINVRSVGVKNVTQLEQVDDTGLWQVTITLIPYTKVKPSIAKPIAAEDDRPQPKTELERKILDQSDRIDELSKE